MTGGVSELASALLGKMQRTNENEDQIVLGTIGTDGLLTIDSFPIPVDDYLMMNRSTRTPGRVIAAWVSNGKDLIVLGYVGEVPQ